jgi:hypothetical protein
MPASESSSRSHFEAENYWERGSASSSVNNGWLARYLTAAGIRVKMRTMERAAFFSAWHEGRLKGVVFGGLGPSGNAASRIQIIAVKGGAFAAGGVPEVQDLFERQARELDRRKREELLHQIQRCCMIRVFALIWRTGSTVGRRGRQNQRLPSSLHPYSRTRMRLAVNRLIRG